MLWVVMGFVIVLGLYMAWTIGANDVANSMADAVGSGALAVKWAVILAAVCEFAGSVLVGSHVTNTIRKGIVTPEALGGSPEVLCLGMASALLAAALWLHIASGLGLPVSTTHSIVGAVAGFGVVAAGWTAVRWGTMGKIVASWVISPFAGMLMAFIFFKLITRHVLGKERPVAAAVRAAPLIGFVVFTVVALAIFYKGLKGVTLGWDSPMAPILLSVVVGLVAAVAARAAVARYLRTAGDLPLREQLRRVERVFAPLVIITSCSVAFAHGANDVANAVGPLAAVTSTLHTGSIKMKVEVPLWILALGGGGIVLGLAMYGYRVMRTVGTRLTELSPSRGVAADVAATTTVLVCSRLGLPVSTTHTIVGAIIGVGLARGVGSINRRVTRDIIGSWLATVPAAAGLAVLLFVLGQATGVDVLFRSIMPAAP